MSIKYKVILLQGDGTDRETYLNAVCSDGWVLVAVDHDYAYLEEFHDLEDEKKKSGEGVLTWTGFNDSSKVRYYTTTPSNSNIFGGQSESGN